jgi:hypothetical protein
MLRQQGLAEIARRRAGAHARTSAKRLALWARDLRQNTAHLKLPASSTATSVALWPGPGGRGGGR